MQANPQWDFSILIRPRTVRELQLLSHGGVPRAIERYLHKRCGTTNTTAGSRDWSPLKWPRPARFQEAPRELQVDSSAMRPPLLDRHVVIREKPDGFSLRGIREHSLSV